jgi:four helix bundle protein
MDIKNYRDLKIWQKSMQLVDEIYKVTKNFPKDEVYGIISQIKRASHSIPANIAEGSKRNSSKEFVNFLSIARGSLAEVETFLEIAFMQNFIKIEKRDELLSLCVEIEKMTGKLIAVLSENIVNKNRLKENFVTLLKPNHLSLTTNN